MEIIGLFPRSGWDYSDQLTAKLLPLSHGSLLSSYVSFALTSQLRATGRTDDLHQCVTVTLLF